MSLCIIFYQFENLEALFGITHDDFGCLEAELQEFFCET